MLAPPRPRQGTVAWIVAGVALVAVAGVPLLVSGPGNDLDVANVFRSGRSIVDQGRYLASRAPGAPIHEVIVGIADRLGGPVLVNLTSLAAAIATVVGLDRLLAGEGLGPNRRWAVAVVAANPWFIVAATSAVDFLFALAFVVWAAVALRTGRPVVAGVLGGLAMGCRVGSSMLLAALLLAELTEPRASAASHTDADGDDDPVAAVDATDSATGTTDAAMTEATGAPVGAPNPTADRWRPVLIAGAVTAAVTALLLLPSYRASGGLSFAQNDFRTATPAIHLGRTAVKNVALFGPVACLVALAAVPAIGRALRGWRTSWLVRFAVPGFLLSQLLFLRFPWKVSHLLPALLCGAVALAVALRDRPRLLVALAVLQLLSAVVQIKVFTPDQPNQAEGAEIGLEVRWGQVVEDWHCRRDHPDAYRGRQKVEVEAAWACVQPFALDQPG